MSALPPKADIAGRQFHVRFVPKADILAPQRRMSLFDDLVGAAEQRIRDGEAQRFRGLEIDHELDFRRLLKRQISRFLTLEYSPGVDASLSKSLTLIRTIAHQPARRRECAVLIHCWHRVSKR
jgi:hypothetical protein